MALLDDDFDEDDFPIACDVCEEDILIEYYMDRGDLVSCEECGAEYVIKARNPLILIQLGEDGEIPDLDDDE
ncbi:MAG: hypothetical protein Kow0089_04250 [Desulfobulbaceae bacterium]